MRLGGGRSRSRRGVDDGVRCPASLRATLLTHEGPHTWTGAGDTAVTGDAPASVPPRAASAPSCSRSSACSKRESVGASSRRRSFGGSSCPSAMNSAHDNSVRCGPESRLPTTSPPATVAPTATGSGSGACQSSSTSSASASAATWRACSKTDSTEPASSSPATFFPRQGQHQVVLVVSVGAIHCALDHSTLGRGRPPK